MNRTQVETNRKNNTLQLEELKSLRADNKRLQNRIEKEINEQTVLRTAVNEAIKALDPCAHIPVPESELILHHLVALKKALAYRMPAPEAKKP